MFKIQRKATKNFTYETNIILKFLLKGSKFFFTFYKEVPAQHTVAFHQKRSPGNNYLTCRALLNHLMVKKQVMVC